MTVRTPVAVIDMGSNSSRIVVFREDAGHVLEVIADEHVPLQLIRGLDKNGRLREPVAEKALGLLRDFRRIAEGAGAGRIHAFGTAALREAANGDDFVARARRESGIRLRLLDGEGEGRVGFLGAVHALPVQDGLVFDIGGGSMQLTRFRHRRLLRTVSLPLGALRLADEFLHGDPPSPSEVRKLRAHVQRHLAQAKVAALAKGDVVVGTGGTARNLAKVDARRREYPIPRLHGYDMTIARLKELTALFLGRESDERARLPGLNRSRSDSIVAGSILVECVLEACGGKGFLVAGQGMREGVMLAALGERLAEPPVVRQAAVSAFAARFVARDQKHAMRRKRLALSLYDQLEPYPDAEWRELLGYAATLLDAGRSIDYYRRLTHAAAIIRASGLSGFTHRGIAVLSSMVEMADPEGWDPRRCSPPLTQDDHDALERAGIVLALADAVDQRARLSSRIAVRGRSSGRHFLLRGVGLDDWCDEGLEKRFREAFGRELKTAG